MKVLPSKVYYLAY